MRLSPAPLHPMPLLPLKVQHSTLHTESPHRPQDRMEVREGVQPASNHTAMLLDRPGPTLCHAASRPRGPSCFPGTYEVSQTKQQKSAKLGPGMGPSCSGSPSEWKNSASSTDHQSDAPTPAPSSRNLVASACPIVPTPPLSPPVCPLLPVLTP